MGISWSDMILRIKFLEDRQKDYDEDSDCLDEVLLDELIQRIQKLERRARLLWALVHQKETPSLHDLTQRLINLEKSKEDTSKNLDMILGVKEHMKWLALRIASVEMDNHNYCQRIRRLETQLQGQWPFLTPELKEDSNGRKVTFMSFDECPPAKYTEMLCPKWNDDRRTDPETRRNNRIQFVSWIKPSKGHRSTDR